MGHFSGVALLYHHLMTQWDAAGHSVWVKHINTDGYHENVWLIFGHIHLTLQDLIQAVSNIRPVGTVYQQMLVKQQNEWHPFSINKPSAVHCWLVWEHRLRSRTPLCLIAKITAIQAKVTSVHGRSRGPRRHQTQRGSFGEQECVKWRSAGEQNEERKSTR